MAGEISPCFLCPRSCGAKRLRGEMGFCGAGALARIARIAPHDWEEPCISGSRGSGTVFFSGCNLRCVYCQNEAISWHLRGLEYTSVELAQALLWLQEQGVHNVNLVTAAPYVPQVVEALVMARRFGLSLPVVYNSSGYETVKTLKLLAGHVDVYLPDLKYASSAVAQRLSKAADYFQVATAAIREMVLQVGSEPVFDQEGLIKRGVIIRHLVLPGHLNETRQVLTWIRNNVPLTVPVSLMAQYVPYHQADQYPPLGRRLRQEEYDLALAAFFDLGLECGWAQEMSAAATGFIPNWHEKPYKR